MIEVLTELGRRMIGRFEAQVAGSGAQIADSVPLAAVNIARDMLTREALTAWMARYPELPVGSSSARNVLIITAGNIPFVGIHDIICVLASGHRAIVRPSSRDHDNISWVVSQLIEIKQETPIILTNCLDKISPDAVVAMGGDTTVASLAERFAGKPVLLRGNRSSAAVLTGDETDAELNALADDVLSYSGLGCRNVSLFFVPRGYDFSELQSIMYQRIQSLHINHRNNYMQARALLRLSGVRHMDAGAVLMVENANFSPQPSILHYAFYDTLPEVNVWLAEHDAELQCVASLIRIHSRIVGLGQTQHPGLADYPDGRDTMQFLSTI